MPPEAGERSRADDPAPWSARLTAAERCEDVGLALEALFGRTEAYLASGEIAAATGDLEDAVRHADRSGDDGYRIEARERLARFRIASGHGEHARELLLEALAIATRGEFPSREADLRSELARIARRRGDYVEALRQEQIAIGLRRRLGGASGLSRSLLGLAVLYEQIELAHEARVHYEQALLEAERGGVPADIAAALLGLAGFLNDTGAPEAGRALELARRALALERARQATVATGSAWLQIGRALTALGRHGEAADALREAGAIAERTGTAPLAAHVAFRSGELALILGNPEAAREEIERARTLYLAQGNRHRLAKVHAALERVHTALGDPLAAARAGREHFRLRNELLGADASGKFGEILSGFALSEARHRNDLLERENALALLRADNERREKRHAMLLAAVALVLLGLVVSRYRHARRLNDRLIEQGRALEAARAELAARHEELHQAAITDALTGVGSRRHGLDCLERALRTAAARGAHPGLLLVDIDFFKRINDELGHLVGDRALVEVARVLVEASGPDAVVARWGGEEFLILVGDTDRDRLRQRAESIREAIARTALTIDGAELPLTVSIGACWLVEVADPDVNSALHCADQALYTAKRLGRNRVALSGEALH